MLQVVHEAFDLFNKDSQLEGEEKHDDMTAFYNTKQNMRHGTTSYLARAVVGLLLDGELKSVDQTLCVIC